jgi:hypothetical protein
VLQNTDIFTRYGQSPPSRVRINNVVSSESCQRDVPKFPFFKAALVPTAGEVQKLQHLDFSVGGRRCLKSFCA